MIQGVDEVYPSELRQYDWTCACVECQYKPETFPSILSSDGLLVIDAGKPSQEFPVKRNQVDDDSTFSLLPRRFRDGSSIGLNISTSAQMDEMQLMALTSMLRRKGTPKLKIIDLREEPHGYVNGMGVSLYKCMNTSNSLNAINESDWLDSLKSKTLELHEVQFKALGSILETQTVTIEKATVRSEVEILGSEYMRYLVPDHQRPSDIVVDSWLNYYSKTTDTWIHYHCRGGLGRSTTFMLMTYIIQSRFEELDLKDCMDKVVGLGGSDLLSLPDCTNKRWKSKAFQDRMDFIAKFFEYARNKSGFASGASWTQWS